MTSDASGCTASSPGYRAPTPTSPPPRASGSPSSTPSSTTVCSPRCSTPTGHPHPLSSGAPSARSTASWASTSQTPDLGRLLETCHKIQKLEHQEDLEGWSG